MVEFDNKGRPSSEFKLELTLEKNETTYPKCLVSFGIIATLCSDKELQIEFHQVEPKPKFVVLLNQSNCFQDVIETYKQLIVKCFTI